MAKKKPVKLTKAQQALVSAHIAARAGAGMKAFIVAGAEVLQVRHGWTEEQTAAWAMETMQLGTKYLQVESGARLDVQ